MAGGINPFGFSVGGGAFTVPPRQTQDIPAAPFGFAPPPSKWDQLKQVLWESNLNAPVRGAYNLMNADPYTLYSDTGAAGQQAAADSFDAAGGVTVGSLPMPKPSNALTMGIRAYHGSPHSFDKFDMSKIGTGEGAQAYGHGLYFAENEGVARGYRDTLAKQKRSDPAYWADKTLPQDLSAAENDELRRLGQKMRQDGNLRGDELARWKKLYAVRRNYEDAIDAQAPVGSMYEVNIDADPNAFLDWDKPLSEQPEAVKAAADKIFDPGWNDGSWTPTGEDLIGKVDQQKRAQILKDAGIPGVKYLDAGSRRAGDGSRNYVVFDDKLISIVKKYGIAGASAMFGYNILDSLSGAQADELQRIEKDTK